jgi:hypothetical protein
MAGKNRSIHRSIMTNSTGIYEQERAPSTKSWASLQPFPALARLHEQTATWRLVACSKQPTPPARSDRVEACGIRQDPSTRTTVGEGRLWGGKEGQLSYRYGLTSRGANRVGCSPHAQAEREVA